LTGLSASIVRRENALVAQSQQGSNADTKASSTGGWDEQRFEVKPGINKDGSIPNNGPGNAGAPQPKGDIEIVYNAGTGTWKPKPPTAGGAGVAGEAGEIGERYLGPQIIEAGGKIVKTLTPLLPIVEGIQAGEAGGQLAQNFIDNPNQPFMEQQREKDGACWQGDRYANQLKQLAAAGPESKD
jgi:hypothetical protein